MFFLDIFLNERKKNHSLFFFFIYTSQCDVEMNFVLVASINLRLRTTLQAYFRISRNKSRQNLLCGFGDNEF